MASRYLCAARSVGNVMIWASWRSGRGFLTLCATPFQHKTEENQASFGSAKTPKCSAEKAMQCKIISSPCASQKMLQLKMKELDREYQMLQNNYQKVVAQAEVANRRIRKCVEDARIYGVQSFCKDVLTVADMLEKTTQSVTEEDITNSNPTVKNLYEGLCLIDEKLCKVFAKHGLEKMSSIGLKYNSAEHEVVLRVPSVDALPGTVVKIVQEGYRLHGRILRTALVGLAIEAQPHLRKNRTRS